MLPDKMLTRCLLFQSPKWNYFLSLSQFGKPCKLFCTHSSSLSSSRSSFRSYSSPSKLVHGAITNKRSCDVDVQAPKKRNQYHAFLDNIYDTSAIFSSPRNIHTSVRSLVQRSNIPCASQSARSPASKIFFELAANETQLMLHRGETVSRCLPLIWLRDHCRCETCYNHATNQKENVDLDLFESGTIGSGGVRLEDENTTLVIHWKDNHITKYSVDWLMSNSYSSSCSKKTKERIPSMVKRVLWNGDTLRDGGGPLPVTYTRHVETDEGLRQTLRNLLDFGFSMVTEAPASIEGIKTATDRVSPIQETFFGELWQFTSDQSFSDTAYDNGYLSAHTDNTYLEMPAGIQVFQCLGHDGKGGETMLVDGFHAVDKLRQSHPDAVRFLSTHLVPHEYKELPRKSENGKAGSPGYHMYTLCPVINLHPDTGEIMHLRFNPYDRAPLNTIPPEDMAEFYRCYSFLSTIIADPKGQFWVKLNPGTILLIDNWRVMHGRSAFDGKRVMSGCYLRRDDWMSRARIMGLLDG